MSLPKRVIEEEADRLIEQCGSREPCDLAEAAGVRVRFKELGRLRGFYLRIGDDRYITVNAALGEQERRLIVAHELGHDLLHQAQAECHALLEYARATGGDRTEYEANIFAAAVLISDSDVLEHAGDSPQTLAAYLGLPEELVAIKLQSMAARGYPALWQSCRADFLAG